MRAVHHRVDNRRILNPALWKGGVPAVPIDDCDPPVGGHPEGEAAFSQVVGVKDRPQKLWRGAVENLARHRASGSKIWSSWNNARGPGRCQWSAAT